MKRMGVDEKWISLVKIVYQEPIFFVEVDGAKSETKQQNTAIRQGCPMSQYLFLTAMTTIFEDMEEELQEELKKHKVQGADFDEV